MPPRRRCGRRRRSATAAGTNPSPGGGRGWLTARRRPFKRHGTEHGDQALPLGDETLLLVFSALSDAGDLVRCAAVCRRWRRLVSTDAAFICRRAPPRCDRFSRRLAVGVFLHNSSRGRGRSRGGDGFVPFSKPDLSLADGGVPGSSSRVVASRNGRVVMDLRRAKSACVLRLCVCDPMTGDAHLLPTLSGKDCPGPYACALLTADDGLHLYDTCAAGTATSPSSYRVLLLYNHRSYTALRRYSSDDGSWGPEVEVTDARIARGRQLGVRAHAALVRGGAVCWYGLGIAVNTATLHTSSPPYTVQAYESPPRRAKASLGDVDRLLGLMPDGRLCVLECKLDTVRAYVVVYADVVRNGGVSGRKELRWTMNAELVGLQAVRLRWFCEKSGVALFTARNSGGKTQVHAVDVETMDVGTVDWSGDDGDGDGDMDVCGYEMDRVAMLAELDRSSVLHLAPRHL
ncbi:hypothetical protein ZWY2020_018955 [Hordeum vulgare]|nr:hypothetical protein ZWY2020_018955 [Hordeum vulgare]